METENRQDIEELLEAEDIRRTQDGRPRCDIPRCLIEVSKKQIRSLGPEPPRAHTEDPYAPSLFANSDNWRRIHLESRAAMEADPIMWITRKRSPVELPQQGFDLWADKVEYLRWVRKVKGSQLDATKAFVLYEQTVGALDGDADNYPTSTPSTDSLSLFLPAHAVTDISEEVAKLDKSIIERALSKYSESYQSTNPQERAAKDTYFSRRGWWM